MKRYVLYSTESRGGVHVQMRFHYETWEGTERKGGRTYTNPNTFTDKIVSLYKKGDEIVTIDREEITHDGEAVVLKSPLSRSDMRTIVLGISEKRKYKKN